MPKRQRDVTFFDLFNPNEDRSNQELIESRLAICNQCPMFSKTFMKCRQCGCYMKLKTTLERASCPLHKW